MKLKQNTYLIFDFDSTIIQGEGLEELAQIYLRGNPNKEKILAEIQKLTDLGMEGKITFPQSLEKRFELLKLKKAHIQELAEKLPQQITPSILANKDFFRENREKIFIISGGFRDFMLPVLNSLGLKSENVLANDFVYDEKEDVIGFDKNNLLSQEDGKSKAVRKLGLKGEVIVIGDGWTDYQIKASGAADFFVAFTENVSREKVVRSADGEARNFAELVGLGFIF